jgi:flagellar hook-associated protein 2
MSTTSAGSFTGSSAFSTSLGQVITRAVNIASLPMLDLQNQQTALQSQQSELQTLTSSFSSLGTALTSLNTAASTGSFAATLSNNSVGSASVTTGALPGIFTLAVSNTGANTNAMSSDTGVLKVTDPTQSSVSTSTDFTLWVNSTSYDIQSPDGTLNGLASAINSSGANVQATVVNVGSSSSPDYRLSVQSVNGEASVNSSTRSLTLATGLTVNVLATGTTTVTISQNASGMANALASFANSYNSAVDEVNKNRGQNGGALSGDSTVYSLTGLLNNLTSYTGSAGNITSLSDLGLTFDQQGHLNFDSNAFLQTASSDLADVTNFLGSTADSSGFLGAANGVLTGINDTTSGILAQATTSITGEISSLGDKITADQTQINLLQQNLMAQMASADAAIATLEQQASYFQMMFQTQNANAQLGL